MFRSTYLSCIPLQCRQWYQSKVEVEILVHLLYFWNTGKLYCVNPENIHTSPLWKGFFLETPSPLEIPIELHTFLWIFSFEIPIPSVGEYGCFLEPYIVDDASFDFQQFCVPVFLTLQVGIKKSGLTKWNHY